MTVRELVELLNAYPEYYEVQVAGAFVSDVHDETQVMHRPYPAGGSERVAQVVVVIA